MFVLNTKNLLVGDIILTTSDKPLSLFVRSVTSSQYSHAMLYVSNHSCIHSDINGVHSENTQRLIFGKQAHASVLRLVNSNRDTINLACSYARTQIGAKYTTLEAIKSAFMKNSIAHDGSNQQFCSRLVAQAYAHAGVKLVLNPNYCFPEDLASSPLLKLVEANVMLKATSDEIKFSKSKGILQRQRKATNMILKQARNLGGVNVQTLNDLVDFVIENPAHDETIHNIARASGYFSLWIEERRENPWRYDVSEFLNLARPISYKVKLAQVELSSAQEQLQQFEYMYAEYLQRYQKVQLKYLFAHVELYLHLKTNSALRITTAQQVLRKLSKSSNNQNGAK